MRRILERTPELEPGQSRKVTIHVPLTRRQRRRNAALMVKRYRDDLILMGLSPEKCRRDLARWDGVSEETMPAWMKDAKP